ncbi:MAG: ABC transporter substrate-binding protein [Candidatus Bathyarchaeia archaeon]
MKKIKILLLAALFTMLSTIILSPLESTFIKPEQQAEIKYFISDDHIRGPRGVKDLIYRLVPTEIWREMFWKKKVARLGATPEDLERAQTEPGTIIVRTMGDIGSLGALWMNARRSPTKFLGFRKAVGHLIDWSWVLNTVWGGGLNVMRPVIYSAGGSEDWVNTTCTFPEYSVDLAVRALEQDGFKKVGGKWLDPEGKEVEPIIIVAPSYSPERMEVSRALGRALENLGFSVVYEFHGWAECEKLTYYDKNYHIFFNYPSFDVINLPIAYKNLYHSSMYSPPGTLCQNYQGVNDPVLDKLIEDLENVRDIETAKRLAKAIQGRIWEMAYTYMIPTGGGGYELWRTDMYSGWYTKRDLAAGYFDVINLVPVSAEHETMVTAEKPQSGGSDWFVSFNPLIWTEALYEHNYFKYIYQPLFYLQFGPDVPTDFVAALAYAYKMEEIAAGSKITFYLFPNATWHDGKPFTAEDVKFTFDFMCKEQTHANRLYLPLKSIYERSEIIDNYTIVVYTNSKSIWQMNYFTTVWILPKHIWSTLSDPATYSNWPPIGTGPYKAVQWVPREYLYLSVYENYHLRWISPEEEVSASLKDLQEKVSSLNEKIKGYEEKITQITAAANAATSAANMSMGIAGIAIVISLVAIILSRLGRKTKEI